MISAVDVADPRDARCFAAANRTLRRGALLLLGLFGCSGDVAESAVAGRGAPIVGGAIDAGDPAVVALVVEAQACGAHLASKAACTGTLVAPRVVLTAGHCVLPSAPTHVVVGPDVATGTRVEVAATRVDPSYSPASSDHDVALVWLAADAPVAPVALGSGLLPAIGASLRVVGFGRTLSAAEPEGAKREGTVVLSATDARTFSYATMPSMTCLGDSGGPVFAGAMLVGVTSAGDAACKKDGVAVRLDQALAFVDGALAAPPGGGGVGLDCAGTCAKDADCRVGLVCREARDGAKRCAAPDFEPGQLGKPCSTAVECKDGACLAAGSGCRCYDVCAGPPDPVVDAGPDPKAGSSAPAARTDLEGGCSVSPFASPSAVWIGLAALTLSRRRRARR